MGLLLGVGDAVDNDSVDGIGSFVTRTDSTTPVHKKDNYKASMHNVCRWGIPASEVAVVVVAVGFGATVVHSVVVN